MSIPLEASTAAIDYKPVPVLPDATLHTESPDRPLPILFTESTRSRWIWLVIAAIVVSIYGFKTMSYWAPADGGVDQNAYLLGGRMIAEHFSTRYTLPNAYAYVGGMMIRTSKVDVMGGDYYPKYPLGLPLLYACFFWIFGATKAATLAFLVSPVCSILAVAGMFFLGRVMAGSFAGLMAAILLGTSELTIELSNNPNSHASCLAFIVWGIYLLVKWWQGKGGWAGSLLGIVGGFLIGYAGLIRYSEGLLILPVAVATLSRLPWNNLKTWRSISIPIAIAAAGYLLVTQLLALNAGAASASPAWTPMHKVLNEISIGGCLLFAIAMIVTCCVLLRRSLDWKLLAAAAAPGVATATAALMAFNQYLATHPDVVTTSSVHWTPLHNWLNGISIVVIACYASAALTFCLIRNTWRDWLQYFRNALPGLAWAVPIATMLIYNKLSMGNWTGYDSTNESEGFTWLKFKETWEQMLRTYYDTAAFFVLPLGLAGIMIAFGRSWKLGLMLLFWLLPGSALYASYYWSPDRGISYARFFLVYLPAIMLGVAICFSDAIMAPVREARWYMKIPRIAAILVVVGIAAGLGVYRSVHGLQQGLGGNGFGTGGSQTLAEQQHVRLNLARAGQVLLEHVPVNAVLFVDSGSGGRGGGNERPLNYIQFLRHWDTYSSDAFDSTRQSFGGGMAGMFGGFNGGGNNPNQPADPNPVPTTRQELQIEYERLISGKPLGERRKQETTVIDSALKDGRGVFSVGVATNDTEMRRMFNLVGKYKFVVVETWSDLPPLPPDPVVENVGNTNGRNRGGGGRRGNGGGAGAGRRPGGAAASSVESATKWELLEVKPAI
jgi:hypothetical protein